MRQIVDKLKDTKKVSIDDFEFNESKIYIAKTVINSNICKLHRVEDDNYAFIYIGNSTNWSCGSGSPKSQIIKMLNFGYQVYELDSLKEVIESLK